MKSFVIVACLLAFIANGFALRNPTFRSVDGCAINRMYHPLCGTDGYSYINYAALECAQRLDPTLRIGHDGVCDNNEVESNELDDD